jgi:hypothetical protein
MSLHNMCLEPCQTSHADSMWVPTWKKDSDLFLSPGTTIIHQLSTEEHKKEGMAGRGPGGPSPARWKLIERDEIEFARFIPQERFSSYAWGWQISKATVMLLAASGSLMRCRIDTWSESFSSKINYNSNFKFMPLKRILGPLPPPLSPLLLGLHEKNSLFYHMLPTTGPQW